jgi:hypothetical protein
VQNYPADDYAVYEANDALDALDKTISGENVSISARNYEGDGGEGKTLAILRPTTRGNLDEDEWLVELIPNVLTSVFKNFSAIVIVDRSNDAAVRAEQDRAQSGYISDESGADAAIGHEIAAQYQLSSIIQKIPSSNTFDMTITITEVRTNTIAVFYNNEGRNAAFEMRDASAVKQAARYLLEKMGVELTRTGVRNLLDSASEANINMARGITAQSQGKTIDAQAYFNNAISFDSSLKEARDRLRVINTEIVNSAGGEIKNDVRNHDLWQDYLKSFDQFYQDHPPFQLVYTQAINTDNIDYDNRLYEISISVGIRRTTLIQAMQNNMNSINTDLIGTGNKDRWKFTSWPDSSPVFARSEDNYPPRSFKVTAAVLDADKPNATPLATVDFELYGKLVLYNGRIYADAEMDKILTFPKIHYNTADDIPENLLIKILSIDGKDGDKANSDGYVTLTSVNILPKAQGATFPPDLVAKIDKDVKTDRQKTEQQKKEEAAEELKRYKADAKREAEKDKAGNPWFKRRFGYGIEWDGFFGGAGAVDIGLFYGINSWYLGGDIGLLIGGKDEDSSVSTRMFLGLNAGYSFVWEKIVMSVLAGTNIYMMSGSSDSSNSTSFFASFCARVQLDWLIYSKFGLRAGYTMEIMPSEKRDNYLSKIKSSPLGKASLLNRYVIGLFMVR